MIDVHELRLVLLAGELRVMEGEPAKPVLSLQVPRWTAGERLEALRQLAGQPGRLYALLQGEPGGSWSKLPLLPTAGELGRHNPQASEAELEMPLALLERALQREPLSLFALRGLEREELQNGVFAQWSEPESDNAGEAADASPKMSLLAQELARLERKGSAVPTSEWLAEAAAEGSLHQPGAQFNEVAARPFPAQAEVEAPAEDWTALLPGRPNAGEALRLIMRGVAAAAGRRAEDTAGKAP